MRSLLGGHGKPRSAMREATSSVVIAGMPDAAASKARSGTPRWRAARITPMRVAHSRRRSRVSGGSACPESRSRHGRRLCVGVTHFTLHVRRALATAPQRAPHYDTRIALASRCYGSSSPINTRREIYFRAAICATVRKTLGQALGQAIVPSGRYSVSLAQIANARELRMPLHLAKPLYAGSNPVLTSASS